MFIRKIILFLCMTISVFAFKFDIWESGENLKDAVVIAKENNIPLVKADYIFQIKKGFDWKYLNEYKKYRTFRYFTTIMGHDANIYLNFTQDSKQLYKVKILWNFVYESKKDFEEKLIMMLNKKYGKFKVKKPNNIAEYTLLKDRYKIWTIDSENYIIEERSITTSISLNYVNKYLLDRDFEIKRDKKNSVIKLDSTKF